MEKTITNRLGFGCMRLPMLENGEIDQAQVNAMVDLAFENKVNYFDTAYLYHGGKSEIVMKAALVDRYPRESYFLADKMPMWEVKEEADLERIFNHQLEKTGAEYFDYYLLHALNKNTIKTVRETKAVEFVKQKKAEGLIRHIGFSYHDDLETLKDFLPDHDWEFIQLQLNYYDMEKGEYKAQYDLVREKGIPIVVMEPVRGGFLARTVPSAKKIIEENYGENRSAALALSYADSLEGVFMVLSGMSEFAHVADNIETFKEPIPMDEQALEVIGKVMEEINAFKVVDCTACEYCLPCPMGVEIPKIFSAYNTYETFKSEYDAKQAIKEMAVAPTECIACGACEAKCPQGIKIASEIAEFNAKVEKFK